MSDCAYYYERTPIGIHLRTKSKVSFTLAALHHDSITPDTLYRVDMSLGNRSKDPYHTGAEVGGLANYYFSGTSVEGVKAHQRVIYPEPWDSTHVHFYYGGTGPRMAIEMRPGANPANVKLAFTGQDSIKVDWQGHLKLYLADKWVQLNQAIAYQVDSNGNIYPVNWMPSYQVEPGNVTVGFEYEAYNPNWTLVFLAGYPPPLGGGGGPERRNLEWSTFVGGSGSDELESVEVDEAGDAYTCGTTWSTNFPVNPGNSVYEPFISFAPAAPCAVVMKFKHENKQLAWATYYGGTAAVNAYAKTKAHKLAVYKGPDQNRQYVFVTGSTNCTDFGYHRRIGTVFFPNAFAEDYQGGRFRAWIGAFTKEDGQRHWASTHGAYGDNPTATHGLAIDVDTEGQVVMGGMLERYSAGALGAPTFPAVGQPWEYKRNKGGAFFLLFNLDYFIEWSSAYGSWHYYNGIPGTRITDLKWDRNSWETGGIKSIWFCGSDWLGSTSIPGSAPADATAPDLFPHPGGGYYHDEGNTLIGRLNPTTHLIDYATLWPGSAAFGLNVTQTSVWVVGCTNQTESYSANHMPAPTFGNGYVHHQTGWLGMTDGFFLRFKRTPFNLVYGTRIGGSRDDVLLDVSTRSQGEVFMTGETRSANGFSSDLDPLRYFQQQYDYTNRRDAVLLAMKDSDNPVMTWRTAFGGSQSDRGWGVAASATEVYLCGATSSWDDDFPLREAIPDDPNDPGSYLDFMQYWNQGGASSPIVPGYAYSQIMSHYAFWEAPTESMKLGHDAFIASFGLVEDPGVGMDELRLLRLSVALLSDRGHYLARLPMQANWQIELFDALGKRIGSQRVNDDHCLIDLSDHAPGAYLLRATDSNGQALTAKLIRP